MTPGFGHSDMFPFVTARRPFVVFVDDAPSALLVSDSCRAWNEARWYRSVEYG
jgi:hypothetical protein